MPARPPAAYQVGVTHNEFEFLTFSVAQGLLVLVYLLHTKTELQQL
jgi:hypothetical protein